MNEREKEESAHGEKFLLGFSGKLGGGWVKVKVRSVFQQASKITGLGFELADIKSLEREEGKGKFDRLPDLSFFARVTSSHGK